MITVKNKQYIHKNRLKKTTTKTYILIVLITIILISISIMYSLNSKFINNLLNKSTVQESDQNKNAPTDSNNKQKFIEDQTNSNPTNLSNHTDNDIILSAHKETDGKVTILTELKNYSDGICNLQIKNNEKTVNDSASVLFQGKNSTCEGFSIPIDSLGAGTWQITLSVTSKGNTNTNITSIKVE